MATISDDIRSYPNTSYNGKELVNKLLAETAVQTAIEKEQLDVSKEIRNLVEKLDSNLSEELKNLSKSVNDIVEALEECCGRKSNKGIKAPPYPVPDDSKKSNKSLEDVVKNSINLGLKNVSKTLGGMSGGGAGNGGPGSVDLNMPGGGGGNGKFVSMGKNIGTALVAGISSELSNVAQHFGLTDQKLFKGLITGSMQFNQQMREIMHTTQGSGVAMTELEKKYLDIGEVSNQTGKMREHMQEAYMKQLRLGLTTEMKAGKLTQRSIKDQQKMAINSVRTANMLGSSVEETADLFGEWNRQIGLTNSQMSTLGRSLEGIARSTGVTGDNLIEAAKAAQQTIKSVRNFGGINEQAMAQIIQMQAASRKFGTEDIGNEINSALAGGFETMLAARPQIAAMMARAAQDAGLALGSNILSNAKQTQKFYQSMSKTLQEQVQQSTQMFGKDTGQILDEIERLQSGNQEDQARAGVLLAQIKASTGMGLGEIHNVIKANTEGAKSFEQKMGELNQQIVDANGDKAAIKSINNQKRDMVIGQNFSDLSTYSRHLQTARGATPEERMKDAIRDTNIKNPADIGGLVTEQLNALRNRAEQNGQNFNKLMSDQGLTEKMIVDGLKSADPTQVDNALSRLQVVDNKIVTAEKGKQDPITGAQLLLAETNDKLRNTMESVLAAVLSLEVVIGLAVAAVAAKAGGSLLTMAGGRMLGGGGVPGVQIPGGGGFGGGGAVTPTNNRGVPLSNTNARTNDILQRRAAQGKTGPLPNVGRAGRSRGRGVGGLLSGLINYAPVIGAVGGGIAGSQIGDGDLTNIATGAIGGGLAGYAGRSMLGGGAASSAMQGMPGFGQNCVPVCIVGGLTGLTGAVAGLGVGGMLNQGIEIADTVGDVRSVSNAVRGVDAAADAATVAKSGGMLSKIPGYTKAASMATGISSKVGAVGAGIATKVPLLGAAGSLASGLAGKMAPFLAPVIGGVMGGLGAKEAGRGTIEGSVLGALTGDAETGSGFSSMLGIQQGSATDELMGVGGAALSGAATGAMIGSIIPGVGTAIGAAVGGALGSGAEIYKILTKPDSPIRAWAGSTASYIGSSITGTFDWMGTKLSNIGQGASDAISNISQGNLSGALSNVGGVIYEAASFATGGISSALADTALSIGSTIGTWVSGFGTSLMKMGDSAKNFTLDSMEVAGGFVSGLGTGVKNIGTAAANVAGYGWDTLMSVLPSWEVGTAAVDKTGVAVIHKDEGIVPAKVIQALSAVGTPFPALDGLNSVIPSVSPGIGTSLLFAGISKLTEMLSGSERPTSSNISGLDLGMSSMISPFSGLLSNFEQLIPTSRTIASKTEPDYINNRLTSAYVAKNTSSKGVASTSLFSTEDAEDYVARQVEGSKGQASSGALPQMGSILDYLTGIQVGKLDEMIGLLTQIRDRSGNEIQVNLGAKQPSTNPADKSNVRQNWNKDRITGEWPLQSGAFQSTFGGE